MHVGIFLKGKAARALTSLKGIFPKGKSVLRPHPHLGTFHQDSAGEGPRALPMKTLVIAELGEIPAVDQDRETIGRISTLIKYYVP